MYESPVDEVWIPDFEVGVEVPLEEGMVCDCFADTEEALPVK